MGDGGALEGFRVVEVGSGLCAATAAMRLGDAGADVIKVEPLGGDGSRRWASADVLADGADAPAFLAANRNKRAVAVDLDRPEGWAVLRRLVAGADVLIEELGPGEAERRELTAGRTDLVHCAITAFGDHGPWAQHPASELVLQAAAEQPLSLGRPGEPPVRIGAEIAAVNTAIFASQAVTAALLHRLRTGEGQRVAVSRLGTLLHLRGILWSAQSDPDEWGGFHLDSYTRPVDDGYRTADGRIYFALRRASSEDYDNLMITLGLVDHLADERFGNFGRDAAPMGRRANDSREVWEEGFGRFGTDELVQLLLDAGGDAVPFLDHLELAQHPQIAALGLLVDVARSDGSVQRDVAPAWRLSETPASIRRGAPFVGEHTDAVLTEAGYRPEELAALRAGGVIR
ncbi:MAG: CaiB/BaiF CoA transferase family protein [Acidimicrobiia bacterium]